VWRTAWLAAASAAAEAAGAALDAQARITEPDVARLVGRHVESGTGLVLAASMPVRDADAFMALAPAEARKGVTVTANRGASGIDGTVATAAGFARGLGRTTTLLVGDLALLHDLNSLALLRDGPPVVVVVLNNNGGGIFHFLPLAAHEGAAGFFEPYFGTPHGLHFEAAARLFGLPYVRPETPAAFEADYRAALASGASCLIEVRTDRAENAALHGALQARCARAVEEALGL
jgi:2-succinyl-5-enolpyruvyl-6-hydroxy-3-cyclohexene-1-carboxylate synthase